jgi:hypothetical protein
LHCRSLHQARLAGAGGCIIAAGGSVLPHWQMPLPRSLTTSQPRLLEPSTLKIDLLAVPWLAYKGPGFAGLPLYSSQPQLSTSLHTPPVSCSLAVESRFFVFAQVTGYPDRLPPKAAATARQRPARQAPAAAWLYLRRRGRGAQAHVSRV